MIRLCALFDLTSGLVLDWKLGNKHISEIRLWRKMWKMLKPGDVVVGDRAFSSFGSVAQLLLHQKVDHIFRLRETTFAKIDWSKCIKVAENQWLYNWERSASPNTGFSKKEWQSLPETLTIRIIKYQIEENGFQTIARFVATTLLSNQEFPGKEVAKLYEKRWDVEVNFRYMKTAMGMDILRTKSIRSIYKELTVFMITYNLIRGKMLQTCKKHEVPLIRLSFRTAQQSLQQIFIPVMLSENRQKIHELNDQILRNLATSQLPIRRKIRVEPRACKRRSQTLKLLTKTRAEYRTEILAKKYIKNS